jgi:hypothetical protein
MSDVSSWAIVSRSADVDDQLVRLERLQDVAVRTELNRNLGEATIVHAGDHHDGGVRVLREHLAREVDSGLPGHVHVAENERDRHLLEGAPARGGALGRDAVVALRPQQAGEKGADLILVVDDQDPLAGRRRGHYRGYGQIEPVFKPGAAKI